MEECCCSSNNNNSHNLNPLLLRTHLHYQNNTVYQTQAGWTSAAIAEVVIKQQQWLK
jgi:hypothetical protein